MVPLSRSGALLRTLALGAALAAWPGRAAAAGHPPVRAGETCAQRQCHARFEAEAGGSVHEPAAAADCGACHDLSLAGAPARVKGAPAAEAAARQAGPETWDVALCTGCHDGLVPRGERSAGPTRFADGARDLHALHVRASQGRGCLGCHAPHAAVQPSLLRAEIPARSGRAIPQRFEERPGGGWCRTGCHAPKAYARP